MLKIKKLIKNEIIGIFLASITILQLGILLYPNDQKVNETKKSFREEQSYRSISDIYNYIGTDDKISVVSLIKDEERWNLDIILMGENEEILKKLNLLNDFIISDYEISYENNEVLLNLHLKSK